MKMYTMKVIDLRPVDFDSGRRMALPRDEMRECSCCGKKVVKVAVMNRGGEVGLECSKALETLSTRGLKAAAFFGVSARQVAYFTTHAV
jgi:hypothetical protein